MVSKGEIWLANLNPAKKNNKVGKIRPVLIFQINDLNHNQYPTTITIPLTTSLIDDAEPIRIRILKRDNLLKDSDLILTQIRAIDNTRLIKKIASLTRKEYGTVKTLFQELID
jgi:mRNA interferase MazF